MYQTIKTNATMSEAATTSQAAEMVVARMPQGYDASINIRIVPGKDIAFTPAVFGCRPRQGATRREAQPIALPEGLAEKLRDANKKVVDWLARDPANAQLFLAKPLEALSQAGVDLTRAEQKALERTHNAVREMAVVAPGVNVAQISVTANPKGRVGDVYKPGRPQGNRQDDAGCVSEGKG